MIWMGIDLQLIIRTMRNSSLAIGINIVSDSILYMSNMSIEFFSKLLCIMLVDAKEPVAWWLQCAELQQVLIYIISDWFCTTRWWGHDGMSSMIDVLPWSLSFPAYLLIRIKYFLSWLQWAEHQQVLTAFARGTC